MLAHNPTCPALAHTKAVAQHPGRLALAGWAYQFPRATSFNALTSNA